VAFANEPGEQSVHTDAAAVDENEPGAHERHVAALVAPESGENEPGEHAPAHAVAPASDENVPAVQLTQSEQFAADTKVPGGHVRHSASARRAHDSTTTSSASISPVSGSAPPPRAPRDGIVEW